MKILIDINHPAHVHYFRNFIKLMEAKGHQFCVINRDSKMINQLLDYYGIKHTIRNKRPDKKGTFASMVNLVRMTLWCIRKSISFRPDMYMGFGSSACAITSSFFRKYCIILSDTEHNTFNQKLFVPCCSTILTPFYFQKNLGKKQLRFNGYTEQLFLHSFYYKPNNSVLHELCVKPREYVLVRYIAYDAHHDQAVHPMSEDGKKRIVEELAKYYKVFVSLEKGVNDPFYDQFSLNISPEKMHDLESNAKLMVTEGATMASESFIHGVPYIYLNPLKCGYINYQCKHYPERAFQTLNVTEAINRIKDMIGIDNESYNNAKEIEKITISPTDYLVWFVENYPQSKYTLEKNPQYQKRFILNFRK